MRHAVGRRLRWVAAAVVLSASGCAGGYLLRYDVDFARKDWTAHPGGQRAAVYAEALHTAFAGKAYADQPAEFSERAGEALVALDAAERSSGSQRPTLIAYRGLLLLDLGRTDEGWAELQRSIVLAPTVVAARGVVPVWGARGRSDKVAETCAQTLPAAHEPASRFQLLDLCVRNMHAANETAALAWAPPEALAFYRAERARREEEAAQLANQQAQQAAIDMASQQAQQAGIDMANQQAMLAAQQAADMANQAAMAAAQQAMQMAATPP